MYNNIIEGYPDDISFGQAINDKDEFRQGEVMKLTKDKYNSIKTWMYRNARPLDLARWQYHFEKGSKEQVIKALEAYQNIDGGFGHGIEADCLNPNSSPLQTWWAIQFIKEIKLTNSHPMIQGILKYLESGQGKANGLWQFSIESNNEYPRAPWWTHSEADLTPGYNPTGALLGFIIVNGDVKSDIYISSIKQCVEILDKYLVRQELTEMHELACFVELYEDLLRTDHNDLVDMDVFKDKLIAEVFETIEQDSRKWASEYCCKPSHLFRSPNSIVYPGNEQITEDELKFMVESISEEGSWAVTWEWQDYKDEFLVSKKWWQGNIAIVNMKMLQAFGKTS